MTFDDFPGWLKDQFKKVGAYIEAKGASEDIGETWLEPFIDQATSSASERAKWVIADANADDLGGSNLFIRAIEAGYYKNGPYVSTIFEDNCSGVNGGLVDGRTPDSVQVSTNVWDTNTASSWQTNGSGQFKVASSAVKRNTYDLGTNEYTLTVQTRLDRIHFIYLRFTDNNNFVRLELSSNVSPGTNRIVITERDTGVDTDFGLQTVTGLDESTVYEATITVSATSIRCQVADSATPTTYIYDETASTSFNSSQSVFAFGNGASADVSGLFYYFKAVA